MKPFPATFIASLALLLSADGRTQPSAPTSADTTVAEFAPPDAYLNGSKHPYYGAENAWDVGDDTALGSRFFSRDDRTEYKRRGQRALLEIIAGRLDNAERYCRTLLAQDSEDLEAYFNLAIVLARKNQTAAAVDTVKAAVDRGLPLGRFYAGPRDLLKPLVDAKEFQDYASSFRLEVIQGPMLGRVSDRGASFWVRTVHEAIIQVKVSADESMRAAVVSPAARTDAAQDYTAITAVDGLKPDTLYHYQVLVDGVLSEHTGTPTFRTFPQAGAGAEFTVVFGGGAGYTPWHERIWDVIKAHRPLAFLWMGDNVYIDTPLQPDDIRYCYYQRQSRPEFRRMVASIANYAIWDDHDVATDDCWMGPYTDKPSWKMRLLEIFQQQWVNPFYGSQERPACWFNLKIADVEFFLLDGRFYRTNPYDRDPTQLGPDQKAWLLNALKHSTATFKVIASGTPWAYDAKPGVRDTWNGFHEERDEIFDFLANHHITGVVLLSGDRHRTDIRKLTRPNGYPLYDWENCRLTNQIVHALEPGALYAYNAKQTFGLLTFETSKPDPTVTFSAYSIDDEKVFSMTLKLSDLTDHH